MSYVSIFGAADHLSVGPMETAPLEACGYSARKDNQRINIPKSWCRKASSRPTTSQAQRLPEVYGRRSW